MIRKVRHRVVMGLVALAAIGAGHAAPAAGIEGRWVLVEQRYENGPANLAVAASPVRLEVSRSRGRLEAWIWAGTERSSAVPWPAFVGDEGPLPTRVAARVLDPVAGEIESRYEVRPSAEDDLVLEIVERYVLASEGSSLTGTMVVRFTGGVSHRGGFTLHRTFEREP